MSFMMTEFVELGGHRVEIRRHAMARRVKLSVDPRRGAIRLTLPKRAALSAALRWAHGQTDWIAREVAKQPEPCRIEPGMRIPIGDDGLIIDWAEHYSRVPQRVGEHLRVGGDRNELAPRVVRWLKREALRQLTIDTHDVAAKANVNIGRVGVGDPRSRWGSCSSAGDIRYSWRLILAPSHVRRATVAHEVAHRVHMNHGTAFHALVDELHDGDVGAARAWLRLHGHELHRFGQSR